MYQIWIETRHEQYYWRWHWLFGGIDIDNWHWIGDFWIIDIDIETGQLSLAIIDIEIDIEVKETIDIDIEGYFKTIDSSIKSQ